jgi:basic amino acid/polyamine antiporter, APA family
VRASYIPPMTLPSAAPKHKLGLVGATALVVGNIIGVGVYMLPASLAPFGWNTITGWGITLSGSLCLAWVFAVQARHLPHAGGATGILGLALGPAPAFVTAWGYWVSAAVSNAAICIGGVSYLGRLVPPLAQSPTLSAITGCGVLWLLTALNSRGLKTSGATQVITTVVKLLPFVVVILVTTLLLFTNGVSAIAPFDASTLTWTGATGAAALTLYSMLGLECAAMPADVVDNPERTVPRATMLGTILSGLLSLAVTGALVLLMPAAQLALSAAPLADFVTPTLGSALGVLITVCVIIGAFGALNGWVLVVAELPAALADQQMLPAWWGVRNRHGAATNSVVVSGVLASVLIALSASPRLSNAYQFVLLLSTSTSLILYLLAPVGALVLARRGVVPRTAGLVIAAIGAIAFALSAYAGAGRDAVLWGLALTAAGIPLYVVMARRRALA